MKVKELIEELQKFNWDMEVAIYDREDKTYDNYFEFNVETLATGRNSVWKIVHSDVFKNRQIASLITYKDKWRNVKYEDILIIYADY